MADQMTPAEMRETAKRLRARVFVMERLGETADDERAGADALDNLADVIEYAGKQMGPPASEWEHDPATILQTIDRIARGETND